MQASQPQSYLVNIYIQLVTSYILCYNRICIGVCTKRTVVAGKYSIRNLPNQIDNIWSLFEDVHLLAIYVSSWLHPIQQIRYTMCGVYINFVNLIHNITLTCIYVFFVSIMLKIILGCNQAVQGDFTISVLQWRYNERDGVSNHQPYDCLLKRLFRRRSKKTSKLRDTGLCAGEFTCDRWIPRTKGQ